MIFRSVKHLHMISFAFSGNQKTLSLIFSIIFYWGINTVSFFKLQSICLLSWKINRITVTQTLTTSPLNVPKSLLNHLYTSGSSSSPHYSIIHQPDTNERKRKKTNQTLEIWRLVWVQSRSSHAHLERLLGMRRVYFNGLKSKMGREINTCSTEFTGLLWNSNKLNKSFVVCKTPYKYQVLLSFKLKMYYL